MTLSIAFAALAVQAAPATTPPVAMPSGCIAAAGALDGTGATLPAAVAGTSIKNADALERLVKRAKGGIVVVEGGDFTGWDFRKADLQSICFKGVKLANSEWSGVKAPGVGFIASDLSGAKLIGAILPGLLLRNVTLTNVDASRADFSGGQLDGGWSGSLAGWKIDGARFAGFRFRCGVTEADGCPFDRQGISAVATDFSSASFRGFSFWGATLTDAKFDGAEMNLGDLGQLEGLNPAMIIVRRDYRAAGVPGALIPLLTRVLPQTPAAAPPPEPTPVVTKGKRRPVRARRAAAPAPAKAQWSGRMFYLSGLLPVSEQVIADPNWSQLLRVLTNLAPSYLMVATGRDRRITARGTAVAETGGVCTIDAGPLPGGANDTFYAPSAPTPRGGTAALIVTPETASVSMQQAGATGPQRIVACTSPAPFGAMQRLPVDDLTFDAMWSAAGKPPTG